MANERFNSWLIDEGETRDVTLRSMSRTIFTGVLLTVIGAIVVWAFFLLIASA